MKTVLITGCSSGIGYQTALLLREAGYRVLTTARHEADLKRLKVEGFEVFSLELADEGSVSRLLEAVLAATQGSLDYLVSNASYALPGAIEDLSRSELRAQFEANVLGCVDLIQRFIPVMRQQGHGRIVQLSSILGIVTMPYRGAYCASKYAIESLGDALRMELKGSGIDFILVEPGPIESHFRQNARLTFDEIFKQKTVSVHHANYQKLYQQQGKDIPFTLKPVAVARLIKKALESARPKARYYVTFPAYFMMWSRRFLPTRILDWLMRTLGV